MLYIVTMYRKTSNHQYILGVYSTREDAMVSGQIEEAWRGGKYNSSIDSYVLDAPIPVEQVENYLKCK